MKHTAAWKKFVHPRIRDIVRKSFGGFQLAPDEIKALLQVAPLSLAAGWVMGSANIMGREVNRGQAEVHAQVGLNGSPCPGNCAFCSFSAHNRVFPQRHELPIERIVEQALRAEADGANAIFFMATGDFPMDRYIEIAQEVRAKLDPAAVMIANVGDFGIAVGKRLVEAGFTGIYHALRMGEGRDTNISPATRQQTVLAAREAGLLVGTCVEPVGPEHSPEEITEKIIIGRDFNPVYSGAARRITIPGSPLERFGMISEYRMAYLVSVVRLAMGRNVAGNCTHEPNLLGAVAGTNLFWAEAGTNPRDTEAETLKGRGLDVPSCQKIFAEADFDVLHGPSHIYQERNGARPHSGP